MGQAGVWPRQGPPAAGWGGETVFYFFSPWLAGAGGQRKPAPWGKNIPLFRARDTNAKKRNINGSIKIIAPIFAGRKIPVDMGAKNG
jgi:hypothetical protein